MSLQLHIYWSHCNPEFIQKIFKARAASLALSYFLNQIILLPHTSSMGKKQTECAKDAEYWIYLQHAIKLTLRNNSTVTPFFPSKGLVLCLILFVSFVTTWRWSDGWSSNARSASRLVISYLRARSKGRKPAWQCDGHDAQKVAQRRSLSGDAEGHHALVKDCCYENSQLMS